MNDNKNSALLQGWLFDSVQVLQHQLLAIKRTRNDTCC